MRRRRTAPARAPASETPRPRVALRTRRSSSQGSTGPTRARARRLRSEGPSVCSRRGSARGGDAEGDPARATRHCGHRVAQVRIEPQLDTGGPGEQVCTRPAGWQPEGCRIGQRWGRERDDGADGVGDGSAGAPSIAQVALLAPAAAGRFGERIARLAALDFAVAADRHRHCSRRAARGRCRRARAGGRWERRAGARSHVALLDRGAADTAVAAFGGAAVEVAVAACGADRDERQARYALGLARSLHLTTVARGNLGRQPHTAQAAARLPRRADDRRLLGCFDARARRRAAAVGRDLSAAQYHRVARGKPGPGDEADVAVQAETALGAGPALRLRSRLDGPHAEAENHQE